MILQSTTLICLLLLLFLLPPSHSIHTLGRTKTHGQGNTQGHGKGKGHSTLDQTAQNVAKAHALEQQELQQRLSMKTQAQAWAKQQANSMAQAEASMAAKEQATLQQDAQAHATSEASVYARMDIELNAAQSAASANTPSLTRNPRLAIKHEQRRQKRSKQAILLEQMLTPGQVQAKKTEEKVSCCNFVAYMHAYRCASEFCSPQRETHFFFISYALRRTFFSPPKMATSTKERSAEKQKCLALKGWKKKNKATSTSTTQRN